jgi:hypothetical protein
VSHSGWIGHQLDVVQWCGRKRLVRVVVVGLVYGANTDDTPMMVSAERWIAGEVMGGVASPITSINWETERKERRFEMNVHFWGACRRHARLSIGRGFSETPDPDFLQRHSVKLVGRLDVRDALNLLFLSHSPPTCGFHTSKHGGPSSRWRRRLEVYVPT